MLSVHAIIFEMLWETKVVITVSYHEVDTFLKRKILR